jgi:dTDP-4-amino-4,6-dideoxygalactose transaminase
MEISESVASRILCLPLFVGLDEESLTNICNIVNNG